MKAAVCKSLDGPDGIVVAELPEPVPGPGEVLIGVKAAALNFLDTLITRGKYQYKPALPFAPASEYAGVVDALGPGVTRVKPGDRVCGYCTWGAAAEKIVVSQDVLVPIPTGVSDEIAAGVTVTYGTATHGLMDRGRLEAGETVAVLGASGGAGLAAVEVAKMMRARVIAVASSEEKLAACRTHGADDIINYATADLKQALREKTGGRGVDVVYDCVGGNHAEAALRSIAWGGRFLVIGFAAGEIPKIPLNLVLLKSCAIVGVFWGEHATRNPGAQNNNIARVLQWVAEGKLKPEIQATYPLEKTADAIRALDQRRVTGKVVIRIG
jgi:NADPH:quinone reductase